MNMNDRLVSEQAVLEAFREYQGSISDFYKAIKAIPSAEPRLIPVSEQPKNKMTCLVYGKMHFIPDHVDEKDWYYDYSIGYYKPKYGWSIRGNMSDSDVMAYMPLPSLYKGGQE